MAVRSIDYQKSVLAGQEEASLLLKKSPDSNSSGIKTTPKIAPSTRGAGKTSAGPSPHPSSNIEIIVAEDHNANRVYAVSLLNKLGYNPRIAANGLEVLEMARQKPCDVILMDCQMPEVDGIEATKTIRHWEEQGVLPNAHPIHIMAVTANSSESKQRNCIDSGMSSFVEKPLLRNSLKERLLKIWIERTLKNFDHDMAEDLNREFDQISKTLKVLRRDIGDEATTELIADFVKITPERLDEMAHCLESSYHEDLRRLAHSYKSVCQIYGLNLMSNLCADLEKSAMSGDNATSDKVICQIKELFDALVPVIETNTNSEETSEA